MPRITVLVLTLAAAASLATGCGKSSSGEPTAGSKGASASSAPPTSTHVKVASGAPLTRAQWIARGDAICGNLTKDLKRLKIGGTAELVRALTKEAKYLRSKVSELAKLVPPASKADDWQQLLSASSQWAEGTSRLAESPNVGRELDTSPVVKAVTAAHRRLNELAKRDGFKQCSTV